MTSAFASEVMNMVLITGERSIIDTIADFLLMYTISEIDNLFMSEINEPTLNGIIEEDEWEPIVIYPKV
jgi:hypothetical protein